MRTLCHGNLGKGGKGHVKSWNFKSPKEYEIWRKNTTKSSGTSSIILINMFVEVIRLEGHSLLARSVKVLLNWLLDSVLSSTTCPRLKTSVKRNVLKKKKKKGFSRAVVFTFCEQLSLLQQPWLSSELSVAVRISQKFLFASFANEVSPRIVTNTFQWTKQTSVHWLNWGKNSWFSLV